VRHKTTAWQASCRRSETGWDALFGAVETRSQATYYI
jgi:hypothetical protein